MDASGHEPPTSPECAPLFGHGRYAEVGGLRIHYVLTSPASPVLDVVLLHGFGASLFSWREVIGRLGDEIRVLAFDRPGFGLTSRPLPGEWDKDEDDPYTLEAAAAQTIDLMDYVGMRRAALVAHSAGSAVAVVAATRYPERVTALVLEDPAIVRTRLAPNWVGPLLRSRPARRVGPRIADWVSIHSAERWLKRALHDTNAVNDDVKAGYWQPMSDERWAAGLWEYAAAPREAEASEFLGSIAIPTLVIAGHEDAIIPYRRSADVARLIPGATLITYEDTGHVPHEERPEMFIADVRAFLARKDVRRATRP